MFDFTKKTFKMVTSARDNNIRIFDLNTHNIIKQFTYIGSSLEWINYTKYDKWILTASVNQVIIYNAETFAIQVNN